METTDVNDVDVSFPWARLRRAYHGEAYLFTLMSKSMLPESGGNAENIRGGRTMPYEIRDSRLLFEHHALSGLVPMLAPTHTHLCMQLQAPLTCAYIHMYT